MIEPDFECDGEEEQPRPPPTERTVHSLPTSYPCLKRLLTADEEIDLCQRAQAGDEEARERMMEANLRLVLSVAKRYSGRSMTFEDIVQEGIIGLLEGIKKFDTGRGNRFSTYATYWIRQAIVRAIEKTDRMIRLPTYGCNAERKLRLAEQALEVSLGRMPTLDELVAETGLSKTMLGGLIRFGTEPLSLDAMIGEDLNDNMGEILADDDAIDPLTAIIQQVGLPSLDDLLSCLKPRERTIIECRYGLRDGRVWTLKECAEEFELSREGVRHTQIRALNKLQQSVQKRIDSDPDLAYCVTVIHG
jgi:RNA polymerase primary sigma factor